VSIAMSAGIEGGSDEMARWINTTCFTPRGRICCGVGTATDRIERMFLNRRWRQMEALR
jgi:hypothetical protein